MASRVRPIPVLSSAFTVLHFVSVSLETWHTQETPDVLQTMALQFELTGNYNSFFSPASNWFPSPSFEAYTNDLFKIPNMELYIDSQYLCEFLGIIPIYKNGFPPLILSGQMPLN